MKPTHSRYRRLCWHPAFAVIFLTIQILTIYYDGANTFRIIGLVVMSIWFGLAVYNLFTKNRLLDALYSKE